MAAAHRAPTLLALKGWSGGTNNLPASHSAPIRTPTPSQFQQSRSTITQRPFLYGGSHHVYLYVRFFTVAATAFIYTSVSLRW